MRVTKRQLKRIIRETLVCEVDASDTAQLAGRMQQAIKSLEDEKTYKVLRMRLRDLGKTKDEQAQFKQLLKVMRKHPELKAAFEDAGLGAVVSVNANSPGPEGGKYIQAFNYMIEQL